MSDNERVKERIRKLLKLAGNNPNEQEAQSALLKAQAMLLEYKIEEHELHAGEEQDVSIIQAVSDETANTAWAMELATILESNFGVVLFWRQWKNRKRPVFFGEEDKATICKVLFEYIVPWLNKKACNYATNMRNKHGIVKGVKQDYIVGFLKGLRDKFQEQVATNESYALVVVVHPQVTKQYEELQKGFKGTVNVPDMYVHGLKEARAAGYLEGKNFNTNLLGGSGDDGKVRLR